MVDSTLVSDESNSAIDTIEVFYTAVTASAGGSGCRVVAFTCVNNGSASATYKAYIYSSSDSAANTVIPQKIVVKDRFDLGPSIIGHIIPPGGSLRMESSSTDLSFRVTGREL